MSGPRVAELLNHLAHRGDVLKSLEEGHSDSREIANKADKSRSSVDRDIRLLKDDGYVEEHVGDYQLTQFGRFALQIYQLAERLAHAEPIGQYLPPEAPFALLKDAEVREASGTLPQRPIDHVIELIREAQVVKIVAPVVYPSITTELVSRLQDGGITVEILMTEDVQNELWTTFPDEMKACMKSSSCTLQRTNNELPFGMVILEDKTLCLGVYDDSMRLLGTITTSSEDAVEWGISTYRKHRKESEEIFYRGGSHNSSKISTR